MLPFQKTCIIPIYETFEFYWAVREDKRIGDLDKLEIRKEVNEQRKNTKEKGYRVINRRV